MSTFQPSPLTQPCIGVAAAAGQVSRPGQEQMLVCLEAAHACLASAAALRFGNRILGKFLGEENLTWTKGIPFHLSSCLGAYCAWFAAWLRDAMPGYGEGCYARAWKN